jgi:3-hydroxyisobutyrate dehydrogenase
MKIGVAGLDKMGTAIAKVLIDVGHDVIVWNRSPEKMKQPALAGAASAASPTTLAREVEAVITIFTDADAIKAVYEGWSGPSKTTSPANSSSR